jgi:hypothetical protein
MAEQVDLVLLFGAEPPRQGLGRGVFAVDAVDDLVEFEVRERPVDRCPRRFDRITLAAKPAGDAPADFEARRADAGSASIAVLGAMSASRHRRSFRRSVSMTGFWGRTSVARGPIGATIVDFHFHGS